MNLGTNFSEILCEIHTFSFKKINLRKSSVQWRSFCLGKQTNKQLKRQSEIAYLPKFPNIMLIVMVMVITEIL